LRLFIIKSEGAKDRRISENMNLLKKLKQKCDSTVQNLFANGIHCLIIQKKRKISNNKIPTHFQSYKVMRWA
jgi:hypothetical protein